MIMVVVIIIFTAIFAVNASWQRNDIAVEIIKRLDIIIKNQENKK